MAPLLKIRSERDQMSAIERRIADFLLENAHLLRDYSSQQLADALKISQSSVVKFSQKFGFKGYPDLKYSVGEAVARNNGSDRTPARTAKRDAHTALAEDLWLSKTRAEEETRLINTAETMGQISKAIDEAGKVFLIGHGEDNLEARAFTARLSMLGVTALHHADPIMMAAAISMVARNDVLIVLCEEGKHSALYQLCRQFREYHARVVSVTRHTANPLRAHADLTLLVSAHDDRPHVEPLLYQAALRHLLDLVYVLLCDTGKKRLGQLATNRERIQHLLEP